MWGRAWYRRQNILFISTAIVLKPVQMAFQFLSCYRYWWWNDVSKCSVHFNSMKPVIRNVKCAFRCYREWQWPLILCGLFHFLLRVSRTKAAAFNSIIDTFFVSFASPSCRSTCDYFIGTRMSIMTDFVRDGSDRLHRQIKSNNHYMCVLWLWIALLCSAFCVTFDMWMGYDYYSTRRLLPVLHQPPRKCFFRCSGSIDFRRNHDFG